MRSLVFVFFSSALFLTSNSQASTVVWTIDTALTTMGMQATGRAPLSGTTAALKVIQQGITPALASITPTLSAKISGSLVTDTDFTSTIRFLQSGSIEGEATGVFTPNATGAVNTLAPGDIGAGVLVKAGPLFSAAFDAVFRDLKYDFSGPATAITGGSFSTAATRLSFAQGALDYRGYNLGASMASGRIDIGDPVNGALNNAASASITVVGTQATLTVPILAKIRLLLDDEDTPTTTDDFTVDLTFVGKVVAHTSTVPEPSTLALAGVGVLGLTACWLRRRSVV